MRDLNRKFGIPITEVFQGIKEGIYIAAYQEGVSIGKIRVEATAEYYIITCADIDNSGFMWVQGYKDFSGGDIRLFLINKYDVIEYFEDRVEELIELLQIAQIYGQDVAKALCKTD